MNLFKMNTPDVVLEVWKCFNAAIYNRPRLKPSVAHTHYSYYWQLYFLQVNFKDAPT